MTWSRRELKKLAIGYFLSAFNNLCLTPLVMFLIYPALITYPTSIILRGLGWRSLKDQVRGAQLSSTTLWVLGGITYAFIILSMAAELENGLLIAAFSWTVYSLVEAAAYVSAARSLGSRLFYVSPISLVGVAVVDLIALNTRGNLNVADVSGMVGNMLYLGVGALILSALFSAVASFTLQPRPLIKTQTTIPSLPPTTRAEQMRPESRTAVHPKPRLVLEVLRRNDFITCRRCKTLNPVEADECSSCGYLFAKQSAGLVCPVCHAPFSMAKMVAQRRFLCGQCASTLMVKDVR
ncbi:MAG: hypothetical protein RMI49_00170 [Candidatus Caldarchaeum sp.]|nr:hypothetical protein [Candidatus Caldarchaeum sp.]